MKLDSLAPEIGAAAPDFVLPDGEGRSYSLADVAGDRGTLVAFICNHCPFVVHIADGFSAFAKEYRDKGLGVVAINANDVDRYPADRPERMTAFAAKHAFSFPYLYDASQDVAKAYRAVCTPDFFLYDQNLALAYAGQFDASRPGRSDTVTGDSMRAAADAVLAGRPAPTPHRRQHAGARCRSGKSIGSLYCFFGRAVYRAHFYLVFWVLSGVYVPNVFRAELPQLWCFPSPSSGCSY